MRDSVTVKRCLSLAGRIPRLIPACPSVPGIHVTNTLFITIQIQWKIWITVIPFLAMISPQMFAHAMTTLLSCHVQNFVKISWSEFGLEQNEISITFELWLWKWTQDHTHTGVQFISALIMAEQHCIVELCYLCFWHWLNSLRPSDAYMRR